MPSGMGQGKKRWDEQSQEDGRHLPKDGSRCLTGSPTQVILFFRFSQHSDEYLGPEWTRGEGQPGNIEKAMIIRMG